MPSWRSIIFREFHIEALDRVQTLADSLNVTGRIIYWVLAALIVGSATGILFMLNDSFLTTVPAHGGSYTEGIIGTPRFINPVLALSDADNDLTALVYSGLLKEERGGFLPDLAARYTVSPDGKTYTVYLRPNAVFQNGMPVTADDVVFTVNKALDPAIKSPLRADWSGVVVQELDLHTVQFTLPKPYAPFLENLTMGILPKALWQNVSAEEFPFSELNTNPVGSGPYQIVNIAHDASGIPSSYVLRAFKNYALGEPYLTTFTLRFYQNENALITALKNGSVEAASGISPANVPSLGGKTTLSVPLGRVFGVFFNQNQSAVLRDADVRQALGTAIDRSALIQSVLGGYGEPLHGPIPPSLEKDGSASTTPSTGSPADARAFLIQKGWSVGPSGILQKTTGTGKSTQTETLAFTLATGDVPELKAAADYLTTQWQTMGADVTVQVYDQGDLSEQVIRPRKYDALLFGEIVGHGLDLFAFWDSSQRNDPGLNIALYANSTVDSLLGQLREAPDEMTRQSLYEKIDAQIESDTPAVFLYSPDFIYVVPSDIKGMNLSLINQSSDRFDDVETWYRQTDHVWTLFAH